MPASTTPPLRRLLFPELNPEESTYFGNLFRRETVGGALAVAAALIAVIWANSPWAPAYESLRTFTIGPMDLQHWGSEFALTLFFFVAGLELKRELSIGRLSNPADAAVPAVAAACGVVVPALVYVAMNRFGNGDLGGWAIPAATDIAFALAVLAVVGSNLPASLRAFLLTLAVVDDLIVIVIIAVFFSADLHLVSLGIAALGTVIWAVLQRLRIRGPWLYLALALAVWWFTHESGIHATIAGVTLGLLTRVKPDEGEPYAPGERLEHVLSPLSAGLAVPFFALFAAGVAFSGSPTALLSSPIVLGVVGGLLLGKPAGVLLGTWIVTRFTRAELNDDLSWRDLMGAAVLAGIGFTVSLLVAELSFSGATQDAAKSAVLMGSLISAVVGALLLGHRDRFHATP